MACSPGLIDNFFLDPDRLVWQLNSKSDLKGKLCLTLADLFKKAKASHNTKQVRISDFLRLLMSQTVQYTQLRSYTPPAFFSSLMQALHRELNLVKAPGPTPVIDFNKWSTVATVGADYYDAIKHIDNSVVRDYFLIQITSECTCRVCAHKTFYSIQEYCLALPIPETSVWRYLDLYNCVEAGLAKKLSPKVTCPNCMRRGSVEVQSHFTRLPPLLVFHFDRQVQLTLDLSTELTFPVSNLDLRVYGPSLSGRYSLYSTVSYKKPTKPPVYSA